MGRTAADLGLCSPPSADKADAGTGGGTATLPSCPTEEDDGRLYARPRVVVNLDKFTKKELLLSKGAAENPRERERNANRF